MSSSDASASHLAASKLSRFRKSLLGKNADNSMPDLHHSVTDMPHLHHSVTDMPHLHHSATDTPNLDHAGTDLPSLYHSVTDIDDNDRVDRAASMDSITDERKRASIEDKRSSGETAAKRLSKLVPKKLKRHKSVTTQEHANNTESSVTSPAASVVSRSGSAMLTASQEDLSFSKGVSTTRSSLVSDGPDHNRPPTRPTLSAHNSHAGLLTLTSPLIDVDSSHPPPEPQSAHSVTPSVTAPTAPSSGSSEYQLCVIAPTPEDTILPAVAWPNPQPHPTTPSAQDSPNAPSQSDRTQAVIRAAESPRKARTVPQILTTKPPSTPPSPHWAPTTVVTPPTPTSSEQHQVLDDNSGTSPSRTHRKAASVGSSKLASATSTDPLTPPIEEVKTPGGSLTAPIPSTGFFSGFISAAQTAASQLGSSLNTSIAQGSLTRMSLSAGQAASSSTENPPKRDMKRAQRSVTGSIAKSDAKSDSGLDHLGIRNGTRPRSMTSPPEIPETLGDDSSEASQPDDAAARAVAVVPEKSPRIATTQTLARPASLTSQNSNPLEHSPSRASTNLGEPNELKRTASVRSKLSRRRHRGSSVGTSGTIAAALGASAALLTNHGVSSPHIVPGQIHRHTGFAVAASKRNKEFHQLFRSVPEDDYLIEDYSAALQKDILLHGRFYVSEAHICFLSNILGWVTNLVIAFDDIVSIEKKNTAIVFPNAITISTSQARNTFASFVARDATYDLLIGIWKTTHSNLKISEHGVTLGDESTDNKTEKQVQTPADDGSDDGSDDDVYDEDAEDDEDAGSLADAAGNGSIAGSDTADVSAISRKTSVVPIATSPQPNSAPPRSSDSADIATPGSAVAATVADVLGPSTHTVTDCADQATHYDKHLIDTTITAPLGKVYNLWFGPGSGAFMRKWMVEDQKSRDLVYEDDKVGLDNTHKTFNYSYVKPLNAPVGPRQTKCIVTNTVLAFDLEKAVSIDCSTHTPDVPSGSIFTTKTRYCLMWGPDNSTRIVATCTIEWTGKSWLKGPIEKGANDGQLQYVKDIVAAIKDLVVTVPVAQRQVRKGKVRRRKDTMQTMDTDIEVAVPTVTHERTDWGLFEPLHGILGPVVSLMSPFLTSQVVIAVLFILLLQSWFFGRNGSSALSRQSLHPDRVNAYDELWRAEESALWDWLEDRVGLDPVAKSVLAADKENARLSSSKSAIKKIADQHMGGKDVESAIRVTEERLAALKLAMRGRDSAAPSPPGGAAARHDGL